MRKLIVAAALAAPFGVVSADSGPFAGRADKTGSRSSAPCSADRASAAPLSGAAATSTFAGPGGTLAVGTTSFDPSGVTPVAFDPAADAEASMTGGGPLRFGADRSGPAEFFALDYVALGNGAAASGDAATVALPAPTLLGPEAWALLLGGAAAAAAMAWRRAGP